MSQKPEIVDEFLQYGKYTDCYVMYLLVALDFKEVKDYRHPLQNIMHHARQRPFCSIHCFGKK